MWLGYILVSSFNRCWLGLGGFRFKNWTFFRLGSIVESNPIHHCSSCIVPLLISCCLLWNFEGVKSDSVFFFLSFVFLFCFWLWFMTTIAIMRVMVLLLRLIECHAHTIVSMPKTSIATRLVCRCSMLSTNLLVFFLFMLFLQSLFGCSCFEMVKQEWRAIALKSIEKVVQGMKSSCIYRNVNETTMKQRKESFYVKQL